MRTGSTVVRVAPDPAGGWVVREPGSLRVLVHAVDRDQAVLGAQRAMANGGAIQVLDGGGFLQETYVVPSSTERPWWYTPPSPLYWIMGLLFVLQGVLGLASRDVGGFRFWMGLVFVVAGGLYLALVLASRRRDRSLLQAKERD